jgi:hypothetical protein
MVGEQERVRHSNLIKIGIGWEVQKITVTRERSRSKLKDRFKRDFLVRFPQAKHGGN